MTHKIFSAIATLAIATFATGAWAAGPPECSLIGTWSGHAGGDLYWMSTQTAGTSPAKGEMVVNFLQNNMVGYTQHMTPGNGVWEQYGTRGTYAYTWYTDIMEADGTVSSTVRVSGYVIMDGCDTANIYYLFEAFEPTFPPQDVSGEPGYSTGGFASETRVKTNVQFSLDDIQ